MPAACLRLAFVGAGFKPARGGPNGIATHFSCFDRGGFETRPYTTRAISPAVAP